MNSTKGIFSHNSDEWETPQDLYDLLNKQFHFTLDPCCTIENHKCSKFFTKEQDGLSQDWTCETVFLNPPYSECSTWIQKAWHEWLCNAATCVCLIPSRTDTKYFHKYICGYAYIIFIPGRLKFGSSKNSAPFPSLLAIFSHNSDFIGKFNSLHDNTLEELLYGYI